VVYGVIAHHGYDGLVLATLMAGVILLVAGFFRAGNLIQFIPEAVVNGFTIGIAVIIATSQLKDLFGLDIANLPADFLHKLPALWDARSTLNLAALGIGVATIVLIVLFRRLAPRWPGLIVAVSLTSAAVAVLALPAETITDRFGALPAHLPLPQVPVFTLERLIDLLPSALVIAFLAGVESLLSAMVADRMIEGRHRPNAELIAQGAANIGSGLMGGLPATGAIARTATNVKAGGRTPVAGLIHAVTILAMMMLAAPLVGALALPALAGLLDADGLEHERTPQVARLCRPAHRRPRLAGADAGADRCRRPDGCHRGRCRIWPGAASAPPGCPARGLGNAGALTLGYNS
jgi:SulP family sulfate permease